MPVEIRELTIKINLSDGHGAASPGVDTGPEVQQALVDAVADKVMTILREQQER